MIRALASLRAVVLLVIVPHSIWLAVVMIAGAGADAHAQFLSCKTGSCGDLQQAAVDARLMKANPAFWAAFSVFGAPEIIPAKQQGGGN